MCRSASPQALPGDGVAPAGIGLFLLLPREVITTFDLRSHRVVDHVSIGRGWYERRRTYAFTEIAGLRLNGYDHPEPDSYMPVMILRNGETRWLSTANSSYLICAMTIEAICEVLDCRSSAPSVCFI
jgi:hypothetical protein